jgi:hypothetical protein
MGCTGFSSPCNIIITISCTPPTYCSPLFSPLLHPNLGHPLYTLHSNPNSSIPSFTPPPTLLVSTVLMAIATFRHCFTASNHVHQVTLTSTHTEVLWSGCTHIHVYIHTTSYIHTRNCIHAQKKIATSTTPPNVLLSAILIIHSSCHDEAIMNTF